MLLDDLKVSNHSVESQILGKKSSISLCIRQSSEKTLYFDAATLSNAMGLNGAGTDEMLASQSNDKYV